MGNTGSRCSDWQCGIFDVHRSMVVVWQLVGVVLVEYYHLLVLWCASSREAAPSIERAHTWAVASRHTWPLVRWRRPEKVFADRVWFRVKREGRRAPGLDSTVGTAWSLFGAHRLPVRDYCEGEVDSRVDGDPLLELLPRVFCRCPSGSVQWPTAPPPTSSNSPPQPASNPPHVRINDDASSRDTCKRAKE